VSRVVEGIAGTPEQGGGGTGCKDASEDRKRRGQLGGGPWMFVREGGQPGGEKGWLGRFGTNGQPDPGNNWRQGKDLKENLNLCTRKSFPTCKAHRGFMDTRTPTPKRGGARFFPPKKGGEKVNQNHSGVGQSTEKTLVRRRN